MEPGKQLPRIYVTKVSDYANYHLKANTINSHDVTPQSLCTGKILLFSYGFLLIFICSFIFLLKSSSKM